MDIEKLNSIKGAFPLSEEKSVSPERETQKILETQKNRDISDKTENVWDMNKLEKAVEYTNKLAKSLNRRLNFSVDKSTGELVVKVIDVDTDEVIRQIPPEEMLRLIARFDQTNALIFDGRYF